MYACLLASWTQFERCLILEKLLAVICWDYVPETLKVLINYDSVLESLLTIMFPLLRDTLSPSSSSRHTQPLLFATHSAHPLLSSPSPSPSPKSPPPNPLPPTITFPPPLLPLSGPPHHSHEHPPPLLLPPLHSSRHHRFLFLPALPPPHLPPPPYSHPLQSGI